MRGSTVNKLKFKNKILHSYSNKILYNNYIRDVSHVEHVDRTLATLAKNNINFLNNLYCACTHIHVCAYIYVYITA